MPSRVMCRPSWRPKDTRPRPKMPSRRQAIFFEKKVPFTALSIANLFTALSNRAQLWRYGIPRPRAFKEHYFSSFYRSQWAAFPLSPNFGRFSHWQKGQKFGCPPMLCFSALLNRQPPCVFGKTTKKHVFTRFSGGSLLAPMFHFLTFSKRAVSWVAYG